MKIKVMKQGGSPHISPNIVPGEWKKLCTIIRNFWAIFKYDIHQLLNFIELIIIESSSQIKA
jgi:hypothetical protein